MKAIVEDITVEAWRKASHLPDHYLRNQRDAVLGMSSRVSFSAASLTLSRLILNVLDDLVDRYLEWKGNKIFVREDMFEEWQELLGSVSPLLIMSRMIQREASPDSALPTSASYIDRWILPSLRYSALPYPVSPVVEGLIRRGGLTEIHCHLNGSTESDSVWIDLVANPDAAYRELRDGFYQGGWKGEFTRDHYSQVQAGLTPAGLWRWLKSARAMRWYMCDRIIGADTSRSPSVESITSGRFSQFKSRWDSSTHPAEQLVQRSGTYDKLILESVYLGRVLERLDQGDDIAAHALYFCGLVSARLLALTVHQAEQIGFDQFQKITVNQMRQRSEEAFQDRFRQLSASDIGDLSYLEGRFAPKDSPSGIQELVNKISHGYKMWHTSAECTNKMQLGLVCHFIKDPDQSLYGCRHSKLRVALETRSRAIAKAFDRSEPWHNRVTQPDIDVRALLFCGIDAASNELHSPPEVFAPAFRYLRRRGISNFTYHCGEDFVHLLSGIRAVHEATTFLALQPGNRLGHCTAVGIDPNLWMSRVGRFVTMSQGDHLDDLVFAYSRLMQHRDFMGIASSLQDRIERLSHAVYGLRASPSVLQRAWQLREADPLLLFNPSHRQSVYRDRDYADEELFCSAVDADPDARDLLFYYHGQNRDRLRKVMQRWNTLIDVDTAVVPADALLSLQELQLSELIDKNIAIECLPTSNLRISFYKRYREHHLFRWLGLKPRGGKQPILCIGTDDPGIFATSIRAEYIHIYRELIDTFHKSPSEAEAILMALQRNAETFRFVSERNVKVR